jgi:hypothetical protein
VRERSKDNRRSYQMLGETECGTLDVVRTTPAADACGSLPFKVLIGAVSAEVTCECGGVSIGRRVHSHTVPQSMSYGAVRCLRVKLLYQLFPAHIAHMNRLDANCGTRRTVAAAGR